MSSSSAVASRVEDAKRQSRINDTLKRSVLDADSAAKRVHSGVAAAKLRSDVVRHAHRAVEQLSEFEKLGNFGFSRRFNPALLLEETGQKVGLDQLIKPTDRGSVEELKAVIQSMQRLQKMPGAVDGPNGSTALATFFSNSINNVDKAVTLLQDTALEASTWARMPEALFMLLEEVASTPSAAEIVAEDKERIVRLQFEVEELEHKQEEALGEGDMRLMEEIYFQRVTVQEAMVGAFDAIFKRLDEHAAEAHVHPTRRVADVHQSTSNDVSTVMHRHESLRQSVEDDLKRLEKAKGEVNSTSAARKKQAAQLREQSDNYLRSNLMQIEQCYSAMEDLQKQITRLADERTEALEQRLHFIQEEDCFAADTENFNAFYKQHKALLEATLQTLDVAEEVTDLVDEALCAGCNAVEQRARDNLQEIEQVRMATHEDRLKQFRQLYLTIGDLQHKKARNMEELEKKIESVHIQQELAMETFNPKAKDYSEAKKALVAVREEMASQVQVLNDKATLHIEAFKPTEEALVTAGKDFLHPVQELEQMNQQRAQKLLEYNKLMSTESGGAPAPADEDPLGEPHRPSEQEVAAEMQRIEEERARQSLRSQQRYRQGSRGKGDATEL